MTKIKICGLMSAQDAEYVSAAGADLAGVILAPGRRRTVSYETLRSIRRSLGRSIPLTGVFVNAQIAEISALAEKGLIQLVQLHGQEDAAYLLNLRRVCPLPVMQAFRIDTADDLRRAEQSEADIVLLDSGFGGTGAHFNHALLTAGFSRPYFLAGGLSPETVGALIAAHHPYGVDVSSGVETNGQKNPEKIRGFVRAIKVPPADI